MLRFLSAFILLIGLLAQTFSKAVIVLDYYVNRDYIAKNLCENRDKPTMNCCGKCQLKKKLKQEDKKDEQNPERRAESRSEVFEETTFNAVVTIPFVAITRTYRAYTAAVVTGVQAVPFHPPCA